MPISGMVVAMASVNSPMLDFELVTLIPLALISQSLNWVVVIVKKKYKALFKYLILLTETNLGHFFGFLAFMFCLYYFVCMYKYLCRGLGRCGHALLYNGTVFKI